jgi:hypothetical protein
MAKNGENAWTKEDLLKESPLSALERFEYRNRPMWIRPIGLEEILARGGQSDTRENILDTFVKCVVDKNGQRLFENGDTEAVIKRFPGPVIMHVFNTAWKLSGFGQFDELGKDYEATLSGASPSGSPSPSTARSRS